MQVSQAIEESRDAITGRIDKNDSQSNEDENEVKIMIYLTTIKETIRELATPEEYKELEDSGKLEEMLEEYGKIIGKEKHRAAIAVRKNNPDLQGPELAREMGAADRMAQEIMLDQVLQQVRESFL